MSWSTPPVLVSRHHHHHSLSDVCPFILTLFVCSRRRTVGRLRAVAACAAECHPAEGCADTRTQLSGDQHQSSHFGHQLVRAERASRWPRLLLATGGCVDGEHGGLGRRHAAPAARHRQHVPGVRLVRFGRRRRGGRQQTTPRRALLCSASLCGKHNLGEPNISPSLMNLLPSKMPLACWSTTTTRRHRTVVARWRNYCPATSVTLR